MRAATSLFIRNGCPKFCAGCGNHFPVHHCRTEAHVGKDGRLYCHRDTACEGFIDAPGFLPPRSVEEVRHALEAQRAVHLP